MADLDMVTLSSHLSIPKCAPTKCYIEGVHLTLPPHIFSVQVKFGAWYITGQWGQAQNKKET